VRNLTSTKREFTALARRLYRRGPLSVNRAFRGVIGRGFGVWIREHWVISNPSLFPPVGREFQTQKRPFALLSWPQPKRSGETNYTFSPTIHLTCFPQQTNNSLFEFDATGVFQTLTLKQGSETREEFHRKVSVVGTDRHAREYRILDRIFHIFNRQSNTRHQNTKLKEFLSSLFSTFSPVAGEVTRSREIERSFWSEGQKFQGATSFRRDFALVRPSSATTDVRNHFIALQPSILAYHSTGDRADGKTVSTGPLSTPSRYQTTINLHTRLDHQFLVSAKNARGDSKFHYGPNVFTTLALDFAAPKVSEMEFVAKRISQFVSSPELTHIKRQQAMSEEMINALRGLRTPHVESTPVPVPVMPSIEQLTSQVRTQLERELRIERERRGL
jgi:hypothetical protein